MKAVEPEQEKGDVAPDSLGNVWHGFSQETTFHGVRFVTMNHAGGFRRILWAFVILCASVYLAYQIQDRIGYFLKEPILVSVTITFNKTLKFPSIAFCNQNQYRFTAAVENDANVYLDQIYYGAGATPKVSLDELNNTAMNESSATKVGEVGWITSSPEKYEAFINRTWDELQKTLGHKAEKMIVRCNFADDPCSAEDFTPIMTDHGLCYKYKGMNISNYGYQLPYAREAGSKEGLNLLLNAESYEYSPGGHASAGFKVVLLDPDDVPMIRSAGEGVGLGTYTFISLAPKKIIRIKSKYTKCTNGKNLTYFDKYTELACYEECKAKEYIEKFKCRKTSRWRDDGNNSLCRVTDTLRKDDDEDATGSTAAGDAHPCICDSPCKATNYDTSFSFLKTSDNDIKELQEATLANILADNEKALDYRVNTDKIMYKKFLDAIKEFKTAVRNTRKVLGKNFKDKMKTKRGNFDIEAEKCRKSLNITATYFEELQKFYEKFFRGPASILFPDVALGTRSLIRNIEEAMGPLKSDLNFKSAVLIGIKSLQLAINDSKIALQDVFDKYGNYTPVMPNTNATDYVGAMGFDGLFMTKPLIDVTAKRPELSDVYNDQASQNEKEMNYFAYAFKTNNVGAFNAAKKGLSDAMIRLATIRRDLMDNTFNLPVSNAYWSSKKLLDVEAEIVLMKSNMLKDMESSFFSFTVSQKYTDWVSSLHEEGFLNVSKYAKTAREADQGPEDGRFPMAVYGVREYLTEAYLRFSRLYTNYFLFQKKVTDAAKEANDEIRSSIDSRQHAAADILLKTKLDINSCKDMESNDWGDFFKTSKAAIKDVMEIYIPKFERLKMILDEHAAQLQPTGNFYKDNFAAVDIYFQDMSYETIEQDLAYDVVALLSDVGGSMGLLIGGSCLTVCELLDTVAFSVGLYWSRRRKTASANDDQAKQ